MGRIPVQKGRADHGSHPTRNIPWCRLEKDEVGEKKTLNFQQPELGKYLMAMRRSQAGDLSTRKGLSSFLGISKEVLVEIEEGRSDPRPEVIQWIEQQEKLELPPPRGSRGGVLDYLLEKFQFRADQKILDMPCGPGWLTWELRRKGLDVVAADLFPETFRGGEPAAIPADMNTVLPFPDESFDIILSAEGVEHLENPWQAFREFYRILKPAGRLLLTTPNYSNIERRVSYLLKGSAARPPLPIHRHRDIPFNDPPHLSTFPACYWKLAGDLAGFTLEIMETCARHRKQWLFFPLALVICLIGKCARGTTRVRYEMDRTQKLSHLLGGRSLIMVFRKGLGTES